MSPRAPRRPAFRLLPWLLAAALVGAAAAEPSPAESPPATAATPAPAPRDPADLGHGLRYLRLGEHTDSAALAAASAAPALVLDLRAAAAGPAELGAALAGRDHVRPAFVLLGAATPAAIRAALAHPPAGVLTLAPKESAIPASLVLDVSTASDQAAVAALAGGRPPYELIEEKVEKQRFDEARLAQNHANGVRDSADAPAPKTESPAADPAPAPTRDLLLQRAVFLHRALLALDRIPEHT